MDPFVISFYLCIILVVISCTFLTINIYDHLTRLRYKNFFTIFSFPYILFSNMVLEF